MITSKTLIPDERFLAYYNKLREELNLAYTYYEISKTLREMKGTRHAEFSEALTFLSLTLNATLFSTVMSINRFIDSHRDSLHLDEFFDFIRGNLNLFSTSAFKKRLLDSGRDSDDCEYWGKLHINITAAMIDQDKEKIKSLPVHNLKIWRDKKLAHIEKNLVTKNVNILKENPVDIRDIDNIIITLHEILDRYRSAYDGVIWMLGLPSVKPQIEYVMDAILLYRKSKKER